MNASTFVRRAVVGVLLVAYSLVFGEYFVRIMKPQPLVPRFVTGAADGIRANLPGVVYTQTTPEATVRIAHNRQGLRAERDYPLAKPAGTCRVALLGDSFFAGFESSLEDSFAGQLEAQLRQAGHRCEVLNFAVSGFGTAEDLVALRSRVLPFSPDILIVSWHVTDPQDNRRSRLFRLDGDVLTPTGRSYLPGVEISDFLMRFGAYRWAVEHSHLYTAAREWVGVNGKRLMLQLAHLQDKRTAPGDTTGAAVAAPSPASAASAAASASDAAESALDVALIAALDREMTSHGGKFMLLEIPNRLSRTQLESSLALLPPDVPSRFNVASPLKAMRAHLGPDTKLYLEQGQGHWSPLGNRLAAQAAVAFIAEHRWLAPSAPSDVVRP